MAADRARQGVSPGGLVTGAGWVLLLLAAASAVAGHLFPLELFVHFWPQLGAALLLTAVTSGVRGRRLASVAQGAGGAALLVAVGWMVTGARSPRAQLGAELEALFANVGTWNTHHAELLALVDETGPDLVALAEVNGAWARALRPLAARYPFRIEAPREDNYGLVLLSRLPLVESGVEELAGYPVPAIIATASVGDEAWRIVVAHPTPPFHRAAFHARNRQIAALADRLRGDAVPTVLLADLNATLWSPAVRHLRRRAGLVSATASPRGLYTWPAAFPPLALGLDHCMHTRDIAAVEARVLESIRSDHLPILCRLSRGEGSSAAENP